MTCVRYQADADKLKEYEEFNKFEKVTVSIHDAFSESQSDKSTLEREFLLSIEKPVEGLHKIIDEFNKRDVMPLGTLYLLNADTEWSKQLLTIWKSNNGRGLAKSEVLNLGWYLRVINDNDSTRQDYFVKSDNRKKAARLLRRYLEEHIKSSQLEHSKIQYIEMDNENVIYDYLTRNIIEAIINNQN